MTTFSTNDRLTELAPVWSAEPAGRMYRRVGHVIGHPPLEESVADVPVPPHEPRPSRYSACRLVCRARQTLRLSGLEMSCINWQHRDLLDSWGGGVASSRWASGRHLRLD